MSNSTTYITFSAIDYKGLDSLSSYALSITPLIFVPDLENSINHKMVWDFGDGTIAKTFSASKFYKFPGIYTVSLIQYDCNNNAMISSVTKTIQIYDYIPLTFDVTFMGFVLDPNGNYNLTEGGDFILMEDGSYSLTEEDSNVITLSAGQISTPIRLNSYFPSYQPALDVYYDIYNSNSLNWWDINSNKYAHLESFNVFYEQIYNYTLSSYQYSEIPKITTDQNPIFVKVNNGTIVQCLSSDDDSCYAGLSGTKLVYIKEDNVTEQLLSYLSFDKTKYIHPYNTNFNYLNNLGITLSATVVENVPVRLNVTSNGLDGEGFPVDSFEIAPIKFYNTKIPFVVKIKDYLDFSIKNFDTIQLSSLNYTLTTTFDLQLATELGEFLLDELGNEIFANGTTVTVSTSAYSISSLNYTLSAQNTGGSFRGFVTFPAQEDLIQNVRLEFNATLTDDQGNSWFLEGVSNYFNVYPTNYFDMYKKNEDFNAAETLKDLRFQEILIDKNILFDDFFGGILGGDSTQHEDIGVKTYEASANFVQNTQDIDDSTIDALDSMGEFMGYNDVNEEKYIYPVKVKRLVDLLSIDKIKLLGYENKFRENFDVKGRSSKTIFGINIGNQIDTTTYVISSTTPIVALEKFSNEYTLLNTYQPVSAVGTHTYPLSSFTSDWGWPLVLPVSLNFSEIEKYYLFFDFVDQYDNTILDGVVDFDNPKTTIPFLTTGEDLNELDGIKEHMFVDTLYTSLSLIY